MPSGQELATLSESIEPEHIPKKYGGKFDFEFGMPPDLDPEIRNMVNREDDPTHKLPLGPMRWVRTEDGKREAIAVGSEDGKERRTRVMTLL